LSQRVQLALTVAAVALAAAGAVVGVTLETRDNPPKLHPQPGKPPVPATLPGPLGAQLQQAFAHWPHGSVPALERLGQQHPKDPLVQLYLGIGLFWAGYTNEAGQALEQVKKKGVGYDTRWEVAADNILHPQFAPNYPIFQPLRPNPLLARGSRLQLEGHQHSAERLYLRAAARAPGDDEAQVAAAVGAFDKDDLTPAFSRLGPLTRRFPKSQLVRFYLGELLAWTDQRTEACSQFEKTVALGPSSDLARSAKSFLGRACAGGTGGAKK
jgi:tetratricopeptide (TPR) repeat protein